MEDGSLAGLADDAGSWLGAQLRLSWEHLTGVVARFWEEHPESQCFKSQEEVASRPMKGYFQNELNFCDVPLSSSRLKGMHT